MKLFHSKEVLDLDKIDFRPEPEPVQSLEAFRTGTRNVIDKLDAKCIQLRVEIDERQNHLAELERAKAGYELALAHMED